MIPDDRVYTKYHLWVKAVDRLFEVGITEPLLRKLRPLISIDLPDADDEVKAELPFGDLEGARETYQLYLPLESRIAGVNDELTWNQDKLLKDPYEQGWLLRVQPHDLEAVAKLWSPALYATFCAADLGKEFVNG